MGKVSINQSRVEQTAASISGRVQTEVIDAGTASAKKMISALENSCGDFADSLREEIQKEMTAIEETGQLLIALANYIKSAAADFDEVDKAHQDLRVN